MTALPVAPPGQDTCSRCRHAVPLLVDDTGLCITCDSLIEGPNMTNTAEISNVPKHTKAAILRALAKDQHPLRLMPNLAHRYNLTLDDVKAIAEMHGWPKPDSMLKAADILTGAAAPAPQFPRPSAVPDTDVDDQDDDDQPAAAPKDTIAALLAKAEESTKARTRNLGEKIRGLIADLRQVLDEEQASAKARKEVEDLERQLREAKARLHVSTPTTTPTAAATGATAKEIRAWAAANNVDCKQIGIVPKAVRDAYAKAHA